MKNNLQENSYSFPYHYADMASEEFKNILAIEYLEKIDTIIQILQLSKKISMVDVGCGDGRLLHEARKQTKLLTGIDCSKRAIDFAKAFNPDTIFNYLDITEDGYVSSEKFDRVTCIDVLEHLPKIQQRLMVKKLSGFCANDGMCVISVPSTNLPVLPKHHNHYTEKSLHELLDPYFSEITIIGYLPVIYQNRLRAGKAIGTILYPYKQKIKIISNFYAFLKKDLHNNFTCKQADGLGLLAICKK